MNTKIFKSLISLLIVVTIVTQVATPSVTNAAALNWDTPNVGSTPFKVRPKDFINPQLLMSVVGCTGVVNTVAGKVVNFVQDITATVKERAMKQFVQICKGYQKGTAAGLAATSSTALGTGTPVGKQLGEIMMDTKCPNETEPTKDEAAIKAADKRQLIEQCFSGIAVTLAKNQLTSMTKATFNWVNTGFNGDPFFITNINEMLNNIEQDVVTRETDIFRGTCVARAPISSIFDPVAHTFKDTTPREKDGSVKCLQYKNDNLGNKYPYGANFARAEINSYKSQQNIDSSLTQNLTNWLPEGSTINSYSTNFSEGGWGAWLALTQRPANNPLGYTMVKSQNIAEKQDTAKQDLKDQSIRNGGYLDQTECADEDNGITTTKCKITKVVTPGSAIRDKVSAAINSPERQLELAKTMNDSLNAVFTALLSKLFDGGIAALSSVRSTQYTDIANLSTDSFGNLQTNSPSKFSTSSFDASTGLGNKYTEAIDGGSWDAKNNIPELSRTNGAKNQYYTVVLGGNTQLTQDGHTWKVGEKAFFDGMLWHVGVPKYVIDSRGGLQMQYDFNTHSKENLTILPKVIPKLGELDYCIPGPNQNWSNNSTEIKEAFSNYVDSIYTKSGERKVCDFLCITKHTVTYPVLSMPNPGQYKTYFDNWPDLWAKITRSELYTTAIVTLNNGKGSWQPDWQINPDTVDAEKDYIQKAVDALWKEYGDKVSALYGPQGLIDRKSVV